MIILAKLVASFHEQLQNDVWPIKTIQTQHLAIQRRLLIYALKARSIEVSFKRITDLSNLLNLATFDQIQSLNLKQRMVH